ncbi:MAG: hypothetical protein ACRD8A_12670 [Candidatus Acidiferrales bacterium]
MPITVNGFDGNPFDQRSIESLQGRFIVCHYLLGLLGNQAVGGDTLDFTNGGVNSAVPTLGRGIASAVTEESAATAASFIGSGGYFALIGLPTSALNAWKLLGYSAGGTAQSGAYAGFTGGSALVDSIALKVTWYR